MQSQTNSSAKIRVLFVDNNEELAEILGQCVAAESDMENAGCLHAADDLLTEVNRTRANIVLLDLGMPGKDPLAAVRELAIAQADSGRSGGARVIVFSGRSDEGAVDGAVKAGAWGYLSKNAEIAVMLQAIREVARGGISFAAWQ